MTDQPTRVRVSSPTELRNLATVEIDTVSTDAALAMLHAEDARVVPAVAAVLPDLARLVDAAVERIGRGGRVHYFGAGTSGRLAVLDAAELMPTFGLGDVVIAHHAGGPEALLTAAENVEDDEDDGVAVARELTSADIAIGLTASGRTPFVAGALRAARSAGALTALVTSNPEPELAALADLVLAADTGPEALTGSTRLKAGTAEKLILNGFSTVLMVRLGRSYSNLMIGMRPTNAKLRGRSVELLVQATGESPARCAAALDAVNLGATSPDGTSVDGTSVDGTSVGAAPPDGMVLRATGDLPTALVLLLSGTAEDAGGVARCRDALRRSGGRVRAALAELL